MPDVYFGINRGQHKEGVVVSADPTGAAIELKVSMDKVPSGLDARLGIEYITQVFLQRGWPVAP